MKVAFHSNQLCERGTEVALYDYAHFNEILLRNQSLILANGRNKNNVRTVVERFKKRFRVHLYNDFSEVEGLLAREDVDALYMIKKGVNDGLITTKCRTVVHCVFDTTEPHGDLYACISEYLNKRFQTSLPVVPHMVHLPQVEGNLRKEQNIPKDAVVLGRYGGFDNFDISFVHDVIWKIIEERSDIYFLFMNTKRFPRSFFKRSNKQIIHLPPSIDLDFKVRFINTCDAMLHARLEGETFGLAIAEFSIRNKPIITWKPSQSIHDGIVYDTAHLDILGKKAQTFEDKQELYHILSTIDRDDLRGKNWDAYSQAYNPEVVMRLFQQHFLI